MSLSSVVSVYSTGTLIIGVNSSRVRLTISNSSDSVIWISLGVLPVYGKGIPLPANGGRLVLDCWNGNVYATHNWLGIYKDIGVLEE